MEDKSEMRLMSDLESELDIEIFKKFVTPYYQPSNKPLVMCVGAQSPDEGTAIRRFHTQQYRIKGNDVKVAACNIRDGIGSMLQRLNSYDSFMSRFLTKTPCFSMELNLEHPKVPNKPRLLSRGKTQGLFDFQSFCR